MRSIARGCARQYESRKVILSMGYYDVPNKLNVPGEELPKVIHYYKEAHPYYNHDVLVIGAKNSAAIAALELWWTGARVTLVHRGEGIHNNVKYWIKPNIENRIKNGEIPAYFNSTVAEIREDSVRLQHSRGRSHAEERFRFCDDRLSSRHAISGRPRHPVRSGDAGGPTRDPETLESDRKGMYLAGVLVAGMHTNEIFIENGRFHGKENRRGDCRRLRPIGV